MAKSRDKLQQLGFWDDEVVLPDHDAVCMWAYENAAQILRAVYPNDFDRTWTDADISIESPHTNKLWVEAAKEFAGNNPRPNPKITRKELEFVLKSFTGHNRQYERIVGYADLLICGALPKIIGQYKENAHNGELEELTGLDIIWASDHRGGPCVLVEAKSKLPTIGDLMRQIQLYRTAFPGKIVVVSPDDSYASILSEQDVTFVKFEP